MTDSRNENLLRAIIDGTEYTEEAQSRNETILKSIIDGTEYTAEPQSRIEELLIELKGSIGGMDSNIIFKDGKFNKLYGTPIFYTNNAENYWGFDNDNNLLLACGLTSTGYANSRSILAFPKKIDFTGYYRICMQIEGQYQWNGQAGTQINKWDGTIQTPVYGPGNTASTSRPYACFNNEPITDIPSEYFVNAGSFVSTGISSIYIPNDYKKECYFALTHLAGAYKISEIWIDRM